MLTQCERIWVVTGGLRGKILFDVQLQKETCPPKKEIRKGSVKMRLLNFPKEEETDQTTSHLPSVGQDTDRLKESNTQIWNIQQPKAFCLFWKPESPKSLCWGLWAWCMCVCTVSTQVNTTYVSCVGEKSAHEEHRHMQRVLTSSLTVCLSVCLWLRFPFAGGWKNLCLVWRQRKMEC